LITSDNPYKELAERLDALPNGFPAAKDGKELKLLAKLFSPEEAELAANLRLTLETPTQIATRLRGDPKELRNQLKSMARRGLITARPTDGGLGYGLLPFAVGIYEMQIARIDAELAQLFEDYYLEVFSKVLNIEPQVHRIIPVNESIPVDVEIQPFESAIEILGAAKSWGVIDCICRVQKTLIGEPCEHPLDVCLVMSERPGAFDHSNTITSLTFKEAVHTLKRASEAGLVHSVNNTQKDLWYICNCCTCSCGILRGIADLGLANVVAKSAFLNQVDESSCLACEECIEYCQFNALTVEDFALVEQTRCVGCGVCVPACPEGALGLARRPQDEISFPPGTEEEWRMERAINRGLDMNTIL
jgi:Pyruvate/2-oxoacid:ferredoxin oxidoreductase delta subunit